jgi:hypothetical protein
MVIDISALNQKDYSSRYTYDSVLGNSFNHFVNNKCDNDLKILVVSDSFSKAVAPYLELGFKEVWVVGENGYDKSFVDDYNPDVVIVMFYYFCNDR